MIASSFELRGGRSKLSKSYSLNNARGSWRRARSSMGLPASVSRFDATGVALYQVPRIQEWLSLNSCRRRNLQFPQWRHSRRLTSPNQFLRDQPQRLVTQHGNG